MNGVDTNVVLRYLVQDDPAQTNAVAKIIMAAAARREPLFISVPVLCEVAWVLNTTYKQSRESSAETIQLLLDSAAFDIEREQQVAESLRRYRNGRADFADYLIGILARERGCKLTYTFDRRLRDAREFKVL